MEEETQQVVTAEDYMSGLDKALDEYDKSIGLARLKPPEDIDTLMSLSVSTIKLLTSEECRYYACSLAMYAIFLKKEENRHYSKAKWADDQIAMKISKNIDSLGGTGTYKSLEEKKMLAIAENSFTLKLHKLRTQAYSRYNEIRDLSDKVAESAKYINGLAYEKNQNRD